MKYSIAFAVFGCLGFFCFSLQAQDDLLDSLDISNPSTELVSSSFKATRVINFQSLEVLGPRALDFRIAHRFGELNSGYHNLYGLDGPATIKLSFEYSYNGRWMAGISRSSYQKLYEGLLKYRLLRQTTGTKMPVSVTLFASANLNQQRRESIQYYDGFTGRLSYAYQAIIGRKFNDRLTLQVAPTLIHYNIVGDLTDRNDMYAVATAGRYKFSRSMAITFEYAYRVKPLSNQYGTNYNAASIGIDIETGGHVFQMFFTNAIGMNEVQFIPYTNTTWRDGGIRLGFNVSRVFSL